MHKILIVEDELILASDLKELLEQLGYEVKVAHQFATAMRLAHSFLPELILCDINLNDGQNGIDMINKLRTAQLQFQVIYLTAYSSNDILSRAEQSEPFNYLVKPYSESQVEVAVRLAINHIQQQAAVPEWTNKLSETERKVVEYIAKQKTSKEIAELLFISDKTVRNHRYNITKKLGIPAGNNNLSRWAISQFKISK
jgi:DNA-binding NarL/FixJ family response regulator